MNGDYFKTILYPKLNFKN